LSKTASPLAVRVSLPYLPANGTTAADALI